MTRRKACTCSVQIQHKFETCDWCNLFMGHADIDCEGLATVVKELKGEAMASSFKAKIISFLPSE